ncbi:Crp/Fnr family transcriptional regulator [Dyadobacter sandarakinus]|uniref:Crp/Fnr family transcriptional regulator n=1 Tax=Dyadobacter sandarakinus TaxID=2747268 RepID=A0ABX7IC04_9BACT|nr:Crp/Fnr family transcriptional regulator [Dyadobacter sandarakinus]QRR03641.1 Crp/Fnr family transcriptional regulator [Dyadobacter sandarakinus]
MQHCEFVSAFSGMIPADAAIPAGFLQALKMVRVPKGRLLLADGEICDKLWFVQVGLVRGFHLRENEDGNFGEVTEWFAAEREFFHSAASFLMQVPASESIEALEDCTLNYIRREDLYQLYRQYPEICCLGRTIAERSWLMHKELLRDMRSLSAAQKLEAFRIRSGELLTRVPQKYIASYLGISENYVSKLKARY